MRGKQIVSFLFPMAFATAVGLAPSISFAQCELPTLIASDGSPNDAGGHSVWLDDNVAVMGAPRDDVLGEDSGSVYIFGRHGAHWVFEQKLVASDGHSSQNFGTEVTKSGNTILVGAPSDDGRAGAAYLFRHDGVTWVEDQKLVAYDGESGDEYGFSVAISRNVAVIGAQKDDNENGTDAGSAYIYRRDFASGLWNLQVKILASDGTDNDFFGNGGTGVAIDGYTIVVGAPGVDGAGSDRGAAYVFRFAQGQWWEESKLQVGGGGDGDFLGSSVAISGDSIVAGAFRYDGSSADEGAAYVWRFDGTTWVMTDQLTASNAGTGDSFGNSVSVSDEVIAVGAPHAGADTGAVYVYRFDESSQTWDETSFSPGGLEANDVLGFSVCTSDGLVIAGANNLDTDNGNDTGGALLLGLTSGACCPLDLNGNGEIDFGDLIDVLSNWGPCPG